MADLHTFCASREGSLLSDTCKAEDRFDVLLSLLSDIESEGLNPHTELEDQAAVTVANLSASWESTDNEEAHDALLDQLWVHLDEIVAAVGYTVTTHPDDGACIGLWSDGFIILESGISEHGEAFRVWVEEMGGDPTDVSAFEDAYEGEYDSELDYIYQYVEDTGMLDGISENVRIYFDYEAFARDVFITDLSFCSGYVFRNY